MIDITKSRSRGSQASSAPGRKGCWYREGTQGRSSQLDVIHWRQTVVHVRKFLVDGGQFIKDGQEALWLERLDDEPVAFLVDEGFVPLQLEFTGNTQGLIATVSEQSNQTRIVHRFRWLVHRPKHRPG